MKTGSWGFPRLDQIWGAGEAWGTKIRLCLTSPLSVLSLPRSGSLYHPPTTNSPLPFYVVKD